MRLTREQQRAIASIACPSCAENARRYYERVNDPAEASRLVPVNGPDDITIIDAVVEDNL